MTKHKTRRILNEAPFYIPTVAALIVVLFAALPALAQSGNLALGRSVTRSSDVSSGRVLAAVDERPAGRFHGVAWRRSRRRNAVQRDRPQLPHQCGEHKWFPRT